MVGMILLKNIKRKRLKTDAKTFLTIFVENKNKDIKRFEKDFDVEFPQLQKNAFNSEDVKDYLFVPKSEKIGAVWAIKIPSSKELTSDFFRNEMSRLVEKAKAFGATSADVLLPEFSEESFGFSDEEYFYQTFVEGVLLGDYDFDKYRKSEKKKRKFEVRFCSDSPLLKKAIEKGEKIISSVFFARDLANEPAIVLTPQELAKRVKSRFAGSSVGVKVLNASALKKRKMNAILAVGAGSENPPLLLEMHYKPKGARKKLALVGKGVTYDSGGYSLKSTENMIEMKADMAGAAAVIGILDAAEKLHLPVEIVGIIPAVENMINGKAYKPGDVIATASGKTIEVKNTDAEGRIILADALEYAVKQKPDEIIDFATLTGACVVALGEFAAGVFTKDEELASTMKSLGEKTYELIWPLPLRDEYKKLLKSDIADISNLGPRWGGAITAAKFLEFFVGDSVRYAHIDLAGPALKNELSNYTSKWNTGYGVRLIIEYLRSL